ncbi:hypothetical protein BH23VER1_BH23VER1_03370 [soil metagenome]
MELERAEVRRETGTTEPLGIAALAAPPVTEPRYLVAGEVRYEDATGYLEMWNVFGDERYFTRTLGETGPMAKLAGTSDWRPFMLPFNADPGMRPDRLEINVVLPGGGTVELRGLKLYQTGAALQQPAQTFRRWAIGAACISLGAVAIAVGWWVTRRRRRSRQELRKMEAADLR